MSCNAYMFIALDSKCSDRDPSTRRPGLEPGPITTDVNCYESRRVGWAKALFAPCPPSFRCEWDWWARGACHRAALRADPLALPTLRSHVFSARGKGRCSTALGMA